MRIEDFRSNASSPAKDVGLGGEEIERKMKQIDNTTDEEQVLGRDGNKVGPREDCDGYNVCENAECSNGSYYDGSVEEADGCLDLTDSFVATQWLGEAWSVHPKYLAGRMNDTHDAACEMSAPSWVIFMLLWQTNGVRDGLRPMAHDTT